MQTRNGLSANPGALKLHNRLPSCNCQDPGGGPIKILPISYKRGDLGSFELIPFLFTTMPIVTGQYSEPLVTVRRRAQSEHTVGIAVKELRKAVASSLNQDFQLQVDPTTLVESQIFPPTSNDRILADVPLRVVFVPDADHQDVLRSRVSEKMDRADVLLAVIGKMHQRFEKMEGLMERTRKENKGAMERMQKENEGLKNELEGVKNENERMKNEFEGMKNENEKMKNENERMKNGFEGMKNSIERLESKNKSLKRSVEGLKQANERLEKAKETLEKANEKLEKDVTNLTVELSSEKGHRVKNMENIRKLTVSTLTPIHLRVLLDKTRQEILKSLGCESWEELHRDQFVSELSAQICRTLPKTLPQTLSSETIDFICTYNNICHEGNMAAHQATQEEMKEAVATKLPDSKEQRCLEDMYQFVFAEEA